MARFSVKVNKIVRAEFWLYWPLNLDIYWDSILVKLGLLSAAFFAFLPPRCH